jgi:hypothetical protein
MHETTIVIESEEVPGWNPLHPSQAHIFPRYSAHLFLFTDNPLE